MCVVRLRYTLVSCCSTYISLFWSEMLHLVRLCVRYHRRRLAAMIVVNGCSSEISIIFCMLMLLAGPWFCRCHWLLLLLLLLLPINDSVKANRRHCSSPISMWRALPQKIELQMLGQADKSANQPFRGSSHAQHIQWKPRWALKVNPMNLKQLHFFGSAVIDIGFPVWRLPLKKYKHSALLLHTE